MDKVVSNAHDICIAHKNWVNTAMMQRQIFTTGRLSSRLSPQAKQAVLEQLRPWALQPGDWQHPAIELELGMGNGMALLARAQAQPERLFIGVEVYLNGLRSLVQVLAAAQGDLQGVSNIRVVQQDARALLTTVPAGAVQRVLIPYPDPWPKARHHKRRLVQPELLAQVRRVLPAPAPGRVAGELWLISDIPDYVWHTLALARADGHWALTASDPAQWATPPCWWVPTKYEHKALREGRLPWYVQFTGCPKPVA